MNPKKNITILIVIVSILAVFFQMLRSNSTLGFFKNNNASLGTGEYISAKIPSTVHKEKFTVIYDKTEDASNDIKNNVVKTLEYMKKDVNVEDIKNVDNLDISNEGVILTFEDLDKVKSLYILEKYVKNGGNLLLAERPVYQDSLINISNMLGISKINGMVNSNGFKLLSNVLIKGSGLNIDEKIISNSSLNLNLNKNSNILAISNENIPLIWSNSFGEGNVLIFNGSILGEKLSRGLIAGLIGKLIPNYIYPVMGTKLTYIDDFPAPVPDGYDEGIYKEYGINIANFYKKMWLPAILKGAKVYNLRYTGTIIEDYNNNTKPPFASRINNDNDFILFGNELLKDGGEMGIHGYNHQSLAFKGYIKQPLGYKPWNSVSDMEDAIRETVKYSKSVFKNYKLRVYVPPSNILSPQGREAILKSMPDLKIISSLYDSPYPDSYSQEFEIKDGVYELPRVSSGYNDDEDTIWSEYNTITSSGVFSHFIHPDDVLDSRRSEGKDWEGLLKSYNSLLSNINTNFKWLKPVTASEGAKIMKNYLDIEPFIQYKGNLINVYCKNFKSGCKFILRSNNVIHQNGGCTVSKIDEGVYLVTGKSANFSLRMGR
ncbi:DUF2194 domain-containing protein [Clostridium tyrobutyricum]|uniref:DUF2194 domain-containing protein n=1 Tax=Clostridium tyrobutyricum TaxID=1519 RepID=UPI0010A9FBD8|nr:DUF2194 domain-containing protein [Clostridium tyrobutyricum]QCH26558.1 hypothetical protein EZN00_00147 [Clostridium tyrobutyricum]